MPTITIHDDDADFIAGIIALIMRADQVPARIIIDNSDLPDWDELDDASGDPTTADLPDLADVVAQRGSIDQLAKPTAGASTEEIKAYVAARAATEEPHPLVVTIGEQERQRIFDTRLVLCPKCRARAGIPCQSSSGDSYGNTFVHNARRVAYNQARRITLDEV